jgi:hypothetical protein
MPGDDARGPDFLKAQFGMAVEIPPPGSELISQQAGFGFGFDTCTDRSAASVSDLDCP